MEHKGQVLLIEDQKTVGTLYQEELSAAGFTVTWIQDGAEGIRAFQNQRGVFQIVITDYHIPGADGMDVLRTVRECEPSVPVLFITAHGKVETAIEAMREGAFDYLEKPVDLDHLVAITSEAITQAQRSSELSNPREESSASSYPLVGRSKGMLELYKQIGRVAATPAPVLIQGETGSGKELVARALHQFSRRAKRPFIPVNCAAIPKDLLESELFGHEKGAFTGAHKQRIGRFEQADGGTLFLDEIGDMPFEIQVKLLRVLQERTIQRLGSSTEIPIDVRVVSATHRNLQKMIEEGNFREDLFHRLAVAEINVPPLRERRDDIPKLIEHFLVRFSSELGYARPVIDEDALNFLRELDWPGNVRQLQNAVRSAILQSRSLVITRAQLQNQPALGRQKPLLSHQEPSAAANELPPEGSMDARCFSAWVAHRIDEAPEDADANLRAHLIDELDRLLLTHTLRRTAGNRSRTARILGVTRRTLRTKMEQFGLRVSFSDEQQEVA